LTIQLLDHAEALRREVAPRLTVKRKSALGQFMTPSPVARFMASLFPSTTLQTCRLLDAGAGVGALSCAFLDRLASAGKLNFQNVEVEAYEIDNTLRGHLETNWQAMPGDYLSPIGFSPVILYPRPPAKVCRVQDRFPTPSSIRPTKKLTARQNTASFCGVWVSKQSISIPHLSRCRSR
jgi:hypothetical protein